MIRDTLQYLDWNIATELSLVIFVAVFAAVLYRAIRHEKREIDQWSRMALTDFDPADRTHKPGANDHV